MTSHAAPIPVGALGPFPPVLVGGHGSLHVDGARWELDWWIGADDRWHVPADEPGVRRRRPGAAAAVETSVRIPSGDAVARVYGVGGPGGMVAVEVANESPAPFVVAFVLRPVGRRRLPPVSVRGSVVAIGGRPALVLPGAPRRWAIGPDEGTVRDAVMGGSASTGALPEGARVGVAAFLHPVAHRTAVRAALTTTGAAPAAVDPRALPSLDAVVRGWDGALDRGLRVELPDPAVQRAVDGARASAVVLVGARARPSVALQVALEDWGLDDEAARVWDRLGTRARRAARRRTRRDPAAAWREVRDRAGSAGDLGAWVDGPAPFLVALRTVLATEPDDGRVDLLPGFPPEWLGQGVVVTDLPTRAGPVSFALRWHGARPALLWDGPGAVELRAPVLDPDWRTSEATGEALLAEPPARLLRMGAGRDARAGSPVAEPGDFV